MRKKLLFTCILLSYCAITHGQMYEAGYETDNPIYLKVKNLQTPDVSSLGTYGAIPVSLYTGTPNISIPVYDIKLSDITVPVSLSYNINNVKPNTHPGIVGLGWNLICGGNITRIQRGFFDEDYNGEVHLGFFGQEGTLGDNWPSFFPDYNYGYIKDKSWYSYYRMEETAYSIYSGAHRKDIMPDQYVFNFLGYTGYFMRDHEGNWQVFSDDDFIVDMASTGTYNNTRKQIADGINKIYKDNEHINVEKILSTHTFKTFSLIAKDGTKYTFGGDAIDYSVNYFNQGDEISAMSYQSLVYPVATTWHLTDITTPTGQQIFFDYELSDPVIDGDFSFSIQSNFSYPVVGRGFTFQLIMPVRLKKIRNQTTTFLQFFYENSTELKYPTKYFQDWSKPVNRVDLETADMNYITGYSDIKWNKLIRIEQFNNIRYDLDYTNTVDERLKLVSMTRKGADNSVETYKFDYYDPKLPAYMSGHYDHLGFYNGEDFSRIHTEDFYKSKTTFEKNADWYTQARRGDNTGYYVQAEMLKTIIYPTGGKSVFEYEPHHVRETVEVNKLQLQRHPTPMYPGGLRIRKVVNYDADNKFLTAKSYYYVLGTTFDLHDKGKGYESGILSFNLKYYWEKMAYPIIYPNTSGNDPYYEVTFLTSSPTNQACYNELGNYVGYTYVVECDENSKGEVQNYKSYTFTNFDNGYFEDDSFSIGHFDTSPFLYYNNFGRYSAYSPYTPYVSKARERGKLLEETYFDNNKNIKKKVSYLYERTLSDSLRDIGLFVSPINYPGDKIYFIFGGNYYHYNFKYRLKLKIEELFDSTTPLKTTTTYGYNAYNLVCNEIINDQKDNFEKVTTYSVDLSNLSDRENFYNGMLGRNMLNYPVETILYKNGNVIGSTVRNYSFAKQTGNKILPDTIFKLETTIPLSDYSRVGTNGRKLIYDKRCKPEIIFQEYDIFGNPVSVKDRSSSSIYIWSYNGNYLLAKIENADFNEVYRQLPFSIRESSMDISVHYMSEIDALRAKFPNALITTYTYLPWVGINKITLPNGVIQTYEYDGLNRLKVIKNHDGKTVKQFDYHLKP